MKTLLVHVLIMLVLLAGAGCEPEIGTEAWCKKIAEKPKGDWTGNEAAEYAKHCLFK